MKLSSRRSGFSLVEFSVALAVLLPVVFGVVDISNTLRAYNALEKGSEVALRCIYPTDGACMEAANRAPQRLFNWFNTSSSTNYYVNKVEYRGTGEWLTHPIYTFDTYKAKILQSVEFSIPRYTFTERETEKSVTHDVTVGVWRSGLPWIVPNNTTNPLGRDVSLKYDDNGKPGGTNFPALTFTPGNTKSRTLTKSNSSITMSFELTNNALLEGTRAVRRARAVFKAPDAYFENELNLPSDAGSALGEIDENPYFSQGGLKAIVYIKGSLDGQSDGNSKLLLKINGDNQGGQVLGSDDRPNFYPRGAGLSAEDGGPRRVWSKKNFEKSAEWDHEVRLNRGENTIEIEHVSSDGGVSYAWSKDQTWTVTAVEVYVPQYELKTFSKNCTQTTCSSTTLCGLFKGEQIMSEEEIEQLPNTKSNPSYPKVVAKVATKQVTELPPTYRNLGILYHQSEAISASTCKNSETITSVAAQSVTSTTPCPTNKGAVTDDQRRAICPPVHTALAIAGVTATNVSWAEPEITVPQSASERAQGGWDFVYSKENCSTPFNFTPPPSFAQYANRVTTNPTDFNTTRTVHKPIAGVVGKPSEVKKSNALYNCDEVEQKSMEFNGNISPRLPLGLPNTSLFTGLHKQRVFTEGCIGLHQDAKDHGLPIEAWFDPAQTIIEEVKIFPRPTDSCIVYREETVADKAAIPVAYSLPEGVTPAECSTGGCTSTFAGLAAGENIDAGNGGPDVQMAQTLAFEAVQASYPRARRNCDAANSECLVTEIESDDPGAPTSVSVRTSMRVPLNLLGGSPVTLTNRQDRELETSFVR